MIFTLEVHGLQFFILSLVNNASYLQTFVFGLMLLHSQYTNDETCYYLQIFALLMLIDYIPHFHEIS